MIRTLSFLVVLVFPILCGATDADGPRGSAGCGTRAPLTGGETVALTIPVGDLERGYRLHLPSGYDAGAPVPLVAVFHGYTGTAEKVENEYTSWSSHADEHGYAVAYFQATGFEAGGRPAATYSGMSEKYFLDLILFSSDTLERWNEDELDDIRLPVTLVLGEEDAHGREAVDGILPHFDKDVATVVIVPGDDSRLLSLRGGTMLAKIDELVR